MARRTEAGERTCVVTREAGPPVGLLRFVRSPDGHVVPDLKENLPGRGVWVTARRDMVEQAVRRRLFARGLKADAVAEPDLPDLVDRLFADQALRSLSMARKAGLVVTGFGKVTAAAGRNRVLAIVHAREAAVDGRRKVMQAVLRRARLAVEEMADTVEDDGFDDDDELDDGWTEGAENRGLDPARLPRVIGDLFSGADLDLALGGANVIHAALLAGGASASFLNNAAALARYRGGQPETDWIAGIPGSSGPGDPRHDGSSGASPDADASDKTTGED